MPATTTGHQATRPTTPTGRFDESPATVRTRIAAAWASMLFVFVYVDLFSLYRPEVRSELAEGQLAGFTIGDPFLVAATAYVLVPSLMIVATLSLRAHLARRLNMALAAVYALTVVGAAIGEMGYYLLGTAVEVGLLVTIVRWARRWPRGASARG